jgi:hypothetical protein
MVACHTAVSSRQLSSCLSASRRVFFHFTRAQLHLLRARTSLSSQPQPAQRCTTVAGKAYHGPSGGSKEQQQRWLPRPSLCMPSAWLHALPVCSTSSWLPQTPTRRMAPIIFTYCFSQSRAVAAAAHLCSSMTSSSIRPYSSLFRGSSSINCISTCSHSLHAPPFGLPILSSRYYSPSTLEHPASTPPSSTPVSVEVEDSLKLAVLIRRFRSRGHLVAQLDPLKRTPGGPWLGPIGDEYSRADHSLMDLVSKCPSSSSLEEQAAFIGAQLQLQGPASAHRLFHVGSHMPGRGW